MRKKRTSNSISVSPARSNGVRRLFNLRIVLVISTVGVVIYGLCNFLIAPDIKGIQHERAVSTDDTPRKESLVPVNQGRSWKQIDDPSKDGWDTEVFANQAKKQLHVLGGMLSDHDVKELPKLVTEGFTSEPLLPANLTTVIDDQYLKIEAVGPF